MKILFLDIDGVLNCRQNQLQMKYGMDLVRSKPSSKIMWFVDPAKLALLANIVERTECKIVIVSTWRFDHTLEEFKSYFTEMQFPFSDSIVAIGDVRLADREDAVETYLLCNDVTRHCVLDDSKHKRTLQSRQVNPEFEDGLLTRHANKVIEILNAKN